MINMFWDLEVSVSISITLKSEGCLEGSIHIWSTGTAELLRSIDVSALGLDSIIQWNPSLLADAIFVTEKQTTIDVWGLSENEAIVANMDLEKILFNPNLTLEA